MIKRFSQASLLAALLALAGVAHAGGPAALDQAQAAIDGLYYETARDLVDKALAEGGLDAAGLARAHRMAGEVAGVLGNTESARAHFVILLVLDPRAALPDGASPKITEPFSVAELEVRDLGPMSIEIRTERRGAAIEVSLDARDPLSLIKRLRVTTNGASVEEEAGSVEVLVGDGAASLDVAVLTAEGHELLRRRVEVANPRAGNQVVTAKPAGTPARRKHAWPTLVRWPTWAAVAVVSAGAGGYFAWQVGKDNDALEALNAEPGEHSYDEAVALEDRGRRNAMLTNVAFGVAGAAAVATVLTFVLEPDVSDRIEVTPVGGPDGAGVTASIRF